VTITPEKVFQLSASGENEESSSDNKQAPTTTTLDTTTPTRVTEFAPKKSIDTFGPRTSIYHGVTRFFSFYLPKSKSVLF